MRYPKESHSAFTTRSEKLLSILLRPAGEHSRTSTSLAGAFHSTAPRPDHGAHSPPRIAAVTALLAVAALLQVRPSVTSHALYDRRRRRCWAPCASSRKATTTRWS